MARNWRGRWGIAAFFSLLLIAPPALADTQSGINCSHLPKAPPTAGASVVDGATTAAQNKRWQPVGGKIVFTVRSTAKIDAAAPVIVCFRWKKQGENADADRYVKGELTEIILDGTQHNLTITATVPPNLGPSFPRWPSGNASVGVYEGAYIVPIADVRILVLPVAAANANPSTAAVKTAGDGAGGGPAPAAQVEATGPTIDVSTSIGVTFIPWAVVVVFLAVFVAFFILWRLGRRRLDPAHQTVNPILATVTTSSGYASLSQFQILLWTFVVGASAVYVMSLSGELITVTDGTLVLLGISGAATLGAKVQGNADASAKAAAAAKTLEDLQAAVNTATQANVAANQAAASAAAALAAAPADPGKAAVNVAAQQVATQAASALATAASDLAAHLAKTAATKAAAAPPRTPRWSDLITNVVDGKVEIDVTRVQMLYFTLITAVFVVMTVITTYAIPDIPQGFLILMGISNSIYIGSKFANRTDAA